MQISANNLTLSYEGKSVISNLTFSINEGDFLCIAGENGSGKSTLIKSLLGLKKATGGEISVPKLKIGYLPQKTPSQKDFPASVFEVVLSGCLNQKRIFPFYTKAQKKMAREALEKLGILNLKNTCYRNLSGGQQQRVFLARALCAGTDLILLDEPVTGLDPVATKEMYSLIQQLNQNGTTVIMVSHDISHAVNFASHVLHLGENDAFFGTAEEYLKSDYCKNFMGGNAL